MAGIIIRSDEAARIARTLGELAGKGLQRIRRLAVNETGKRVRKKMRAVAPAAYGTSAAALRIQARAATPGADDPRYSIRFARRFPVGKLRAGYRPIRGRRGFRALVIRPPHVKAHTLGPAQKVGRAYKLLAAGEHPERWVGGIGTRATRAFLSRDYPGVAPLYEIRKDAERDLPGMVAALVNEHMRKRR